MGHWRGRGQDILMAPICEKSIMYYCIRSLLKAVKSRTGQGWKIQRPQLAPHQVAIPHILHYAHTSRPEMAQFRPGNSRWLWHDGRERGHRCHCRGPGHRDIDRAEFLQVQSRGSCGQLSYSKRFREGPEGRSGRVERYSTEVYYSSITLYYLSQHR